MYATKVYHQELEVVEKLASEFAGTTVGDWSLILEKVVAAKAEAVPDDPRSAAGILGYIHGVRNVRGMLKPRGYEQYSEQNIESARDPATGKQVVYQNVDCAGLLTHSPKAIQGKGAGARRQIEAAQGSLFPDTEIPEVVGPKFVGDAGVVWYFCVSAILEKGERLVGAELSLPLPFKGDNFSGFAERILIRSFGPWTGGIAETTPAEPFEALPAISRKK